MSSPSIVVSILNNVKHRLHVWPGLRQQDPHGELQLPGGAVPPEEVHQLPPDPELPALHPHRGRVLGQLLDGHRVSPRQNLPRRHHAPRRL